MTLQRQWLADSRVSGRHARRVLHDDILPRIHTAMLALGSSKDDQARQVVSQLAEAHHGISDLLRELPTAGTTALADTGLISALRRCGDHEFADEFTEVRWAVDDKAEERAQTLPPATADVLFHAAREAIRNAARHGRGDRPDRSLKLEVAISAPSDLVISIADDGVGADTSAADGTGQGIAIHSTMMAVIGGSWDVHAPQDGGTRVTLRLPEAG